MNIRPPRDEAELDALLSTPGQRTIDALIACPGDVIVLGAGGKMGPTLARMLATAARTDGASPRKVIAVSRFSSEYVRHSLRDAGVETVSCDLLDHAAVARLPDAPNVVFMAGQKFGTADAPARTWMMNVVVPAICAERFATSRIVVFSTGNVYPLTPIGSGGSSEKDPPAPIGEYASSCLGRERVFEHAASRGARVAIVRLNYAIDLRYGVLTDLAVRILRDQPVSLGMGHVNVIWQGDANRAAIELLAHAAIPPRVINVTGAETLSVRWLAEELARRMKRAARFIGVESADALLSNVSAMQELVGMPETPIATMLDWVADWVGRGGSLLNKPTHFDVRDGAF